MSGRRLKAGAVCRAVGPPVIHGRLAVFMFSIDVGKCERCFDCVTSCPRGVLKESEMHPIVAFPEECIGCGVCLAVCRPQGLKIAGLSALAAPRLLVGVA
ncbi:MAG: 4Fe-4S dicluster domain-containing protein [Chloroflexota bacterium]